MSVGPLVLVAADGQRAELDDPPVVVGRDATADWTIPDGSVSRRHAILEQRGTSWWVVDQGSSNGTWVNGIRVPEAELTAGSHLRFGTVRFTVAAGRARVASAGPVDGSAMSLAEAAEVVGMLPGAGPEEVRSAYEKIRSDIQLRLESSPTASLKRMYHKNLQELRQAAEVLAPGLFDD